MENAVVMLDRLPSAALALMESPDILIFGTNIVVTH